eukprot:jgi/Psemu1/25716/gm1.25716_g
MPIWADCGVEWTVRHRDLCFLLGYKDQKDYTTGDWNNQTVEIRKAGLHTRVALDETNFWGPGPLQGDLEYCNSNSFVQADGDGKEHKASGSLFDGYNLGIERIKSYYVEHHIQNRYIKKRKRDLGKLHALRYSCTPEDILPLSREFPRNKILDELDYYRDYCFFLELPNSTALKRQQLIEILCQYCKQFFKEFPEAYKSTKSAVEELDQSDATTTSEDQANQIWSLIYILDEDFLPLVFGEDFNKCNHQLIVEVTMSSTAATIQVTPDSDWNITITMKLLIAGNNSNAVNIPVPAVKAPSTPRSEVLLDSADETDRIQKENNRKYSRGGGFKRCELDKNDSSDDELGDYFKARLNLRNREEVDHNLSQQLRGRY